MSFNTSTKLDSNMPTFIIFQAKKMSLLTHFLAVIKFMSPTSVKETNFVLNNQQLCFQRNGFADDPLLTGLISPTQVEHHSQL